MKSLGSMLAGAIFGLVAGFSMAYYIVATSFDDLAGVGLLTEIRWNLITLERAKSGRIDEIVDLHEGLLKQNVELLLQNERLKSNSAAENVLRSVEEYRRVTAGQ